MKYNTTKDEHAFLMGDALDEYSANQEAELLSDMNDEPELVDDAELKSLLQELWQEEADLARKREEEEYTERVAFDDFYNDYANEMEG
tara:strand:+ start:504 stop:767 length:264 start_codon:yes stop_codon:yes gene_type:complete